MADETETKSEEVKVEENTQNVVQQGDGVEEQQMEIFLVDDFETIKKLLTYTSYPSRTILYQMPNKATSYVDGTPEKAGDLMNTLLDYQRTEDWRCDLCEHHSEWQYNKEGEKETFAIAVASTKNQKQYNLLFSDIKQAIVIPALQSVTIVPADDAQGDILPNTVIRFVGFVQHRFFKCVLVGEDDKANEGKRLLNMKFEALTPSDLTEQS